MSCKQKTENTSFLFVVSVYFYTFVVCYSVSLGQREEGLTDYQVQESAATLLERIKQQDDVQLGNWRLVEQVISDPNVRESTELQPEPAAFPGEPLPYFNVPKLGDTDSNWTIGDFSRKPRSEDKYQADFTGFGGVQGNVLGPSFDSTPHFSEWVAMRPSVQCDDNVMTFTASGHGFAHLLVDREGTSPISLFQLPSYCGYSVRMSWSDLEMMVPYDACYITQENGSYVLPMLWWGSPLKLSCPVQMSTSAPSLSPLVYCSPYGIAVQIDGQEQDIAMLGVIVNGRWGPFVSQECAYRVYSNPEQLAFFISYSAPCITDGDGPHLHLILDEQEYVLSCPASAQVPYIPSPPLSPDDHQFLRIPDPVGPAPTSPPPPPPQPPTQEQIAQLPNYPHYPGFQYPQFPQVYPPGPQPGRPAQPTPGSPPGSQPQQQQQFLYPSGPGKLPYSPGEPPKYPSLLHHPAAVFQALSSPNLSPSLDISPHHVSKFPAGPSQHHSGMYYPYVPFYYPAVTPDTTTTTAPPATQPLEPPANLYPPQYYLQIPHYPAPTAAPVTQAPVTQAPASLPPSPPSTPSPHKQQYPVGPFYLPTFYNSYYHYGQFPYPSYATVIPPLTTTATTTMVPKQPGSHSYSFSQFYNQRPIYVPPTTPQPSAKEESPTIPQEPQKPAAPQASCPPYAHTICGYYPYPYFPYYHHTYLPYYHPPYPPVPQYPATPMTTTKPVTSTTTKPVTSTTTKPVTSTTTTSSTAAPPTETTPQIPHLQCLMEKMVVFLPFAHTDSIQVRDQMESWLFLSSVSPLCGYMLQMAEDSGVILHSPLPACHSEPRTPTTISLPLRFWDLSIAKYRTLDLQCPYQMIPETPEPVTAPVTPSVSPAPPSTTASKVSPSVVPKHQVFCSSNQMTVELPSGPISGIVVKDIKGNHMNLQDAPKHCGYSARKGKDGKIRLSLQLHSRCHMSVQASIDSDFTLST
ncbi:protein piccolo [Morone saxatilis]|uniref:protein piccolo n=1 Tax=Morone saxatilis TaxID=34816 RepID=UPI0015E1DB44|nr:protein piccolo [Morone saxatilis]